MKRLTSKQSKFCEEYVNNGNNGQAAYLKAYTNVKKESTARVNASRLLTNANISSYIDKLQSELTKRAILTAEERQKILSDIALANDNETSKSDRMKAIDILNKMEGSYTTNTNITMDSEINIKIVPDTDD